METIIAMIIIGIWGTITLVGMILVKMERTKAECWAFLNDVCNCECKEENNEEIEEI